MKKIITCLWFDKNAEEAANYYTTVFRRASVGKITMTPAGGEPRTTEGEVITAEFEIEGQAFVGLNGGKQNFSFNDSVSFQIMCADQAEVDEYWSKILDGGGKAVACGWIRDKYGVRWQIVPEILLPLIADPDAAKAARVFQAMTQMVKLDVAKIEAAAKG